MFRIAILTIAAAAALAQAQTQPPAAKRVEFKETFHGVELSDPYHWLEDFSNPEASAWIDAQDRYARSFLDKLPGQESLRNRLKELRLEERVGIPTVRGERWFYTRSSPGARQPVLCVRNGAGGTEQVWLDPATLSADGSVTAGIGGIAPDGRLVAYWVRRSGQDEIEIHIRDMDTGRDLADTLPKALYGGVDFVPGGDGCYYARRSREKGSRVLFHRMGTDPASDKEVFGEGLDARIFLNASVTSDGRWLLVSAQSGWARADIWFKDLKKDEPLRQLTAGLDAQVRMVEAAPNRIVLTTTWKAPRWRALLVDLEKPEQTDWKEVVPENVDVLQGAAVIGGKIYAHYLHNVQRAIRVFSLEGKPLGEVALPAGSSGGISGSWDRDDGFLWLSSFTAPFRIDSFDTKTGARKPWFEPSIKLNTNSLEVKQIWYKSKDGTRIPMYLVHKKGIKPDGQRPVFLTGYGGFNVSLLPGFDAEAVLWAELGGVWAQPSLRGGSEFGEEWHKAGMLENKQNVFDDFAAAAEWLIANRYTNPSKLAIDGTSNGGLLVGAALTQRPELFRAVYCGYPDLDMVRYYRYRENNNPPALLEYGDGSNPKHFPFLRSWSPYEGVKEGTKYPSVLLTTGEGDTRVPPQQAVKMAAKLQWATRSGHPVLLKFDRKSGHAGGRTQDQVRADQAAKLAFLLQALGTKIP